jgi:hypothetical protein
MAKVDEGIKKNGKDWRKGKSNSIEDYEKGLK